MPRLTENQHLHAIGMLQAGLAQNIVVRHFDVHRYTIQSLLGRFRLSGNTRNRQRSGHPRVTSRQQDNHIRLVYLRDRFETSSLTVGSTPDYDQSALEQSATDIVTSGHYVQQCVQFCF